MRTRFVMLVVLLPALGLALWLGVGRPPLFGGRPAAATAARAPAGPPRVPVVAGPVERADVPIYLTGIGTVLAYNSVLVKSRVDGHIVRLGFTEGQEVKAGDLLVEIDPKPFEAALAQAQAARLKDQAQLDNARLDLARASRLVTTGAGTTQQMDTSRALVAQLEASIKADQAQIDMAQIQLNYARIKAPIDGRVGTRLVDAGNIVRASDTTGIVTINQVHPISVDFSLPADTLPQIRAKLHDGDLPVTAQDKAGNDLATGHLAVIDNQINTGTASIRFKATFDNADEVLWPGQFVNVRLQLDIRRDAVTVPLTAVVRGPDGPYAFVIGTDAKVRKQPLKVGVTTKAVAVIEDGLKPGEQVVTDGQYRIQAGTAVDILPPAQPAPAT